jgi:hypothetical protein
VPSVHYYDTSTEQANAEIVFLGRPSWLALAGVHDPPGFIIPLLLNDVTYISYE